MASHPAVSAHGPRAGTIESYAHALKTGAEYVEFDPRYFRPAEVDLLLGDATKARQVLGWEPKVGFTELVRLMVEHDLKLARQELIMQQARAEVALAGHTARWGAS